MPGTAFHASCTMIQRKSGEFSAAAVDLSWRPKVQGAALLILVSFDSEPSMAGNVEIIYDSADGENFDTVVEQADPSESPAVTDLTFLVANPLPLLRGDGVQVKYANPDAKRVNVTIIGTDDYLIGGS